MSMQQVPLSYCSVRVPAQLSEKCFQHVARVNTCNDTNILASCPKLMKWWSIILQLLINCWELKKYYTAALLSLFKRCIWKDEKKAGPQHCIVMRMD